jgi:hypothetical protein
MHMADLDELTRRAVDSVLRLVSRAVSFAAKVAAVSAVICIPSFVLGLSVFDDGMETVWIVLGGFFLFVAVGGSLVAIWRLLSVRRHATQLSTELRTYLAGDEQARRTVIETVESGEQTGTSVIVWSRQFGTIDATTAGAQQYPRLSEGLRAVTTFPLIMIVTALVTAVFAFLGVIFLVAAAL